MTANINDLIRFEQWLRDQSWEDFYKQFDYFTFKERGKGKYVSVKLLKRKFDEGGFCKLWEKLDPQSYYVALQQFKTKEGAVSFGTKQHKKIHNKYSNEQSKP